jgi:hypothetical protein
MESQKLIELYGRRFTSLAEIVAFVALIIIGIMLAISAT